MSQSAAMACRPRAPPMSCFQPRLCAALQSASVMSRRCAQASAAYAGPTKRSPLDQRAAHLQPTHATFKIRAPKPLAHVPIARRERRHGGRSAGHPSRLAMSRRRVLEPQHARRTSVPRMAPAAVTEPPATAPRAASQALARVALRLAARTVMSAPQTCAPSLRAAPLCASLAAATSARNAPIWMAIHARTLSAVTRIDALRSPAIAVTRTRALRTPASRVEAAHTPRLQVVVHKTQGSMRRRSMRALVLSMSACATPARATQVRGMQASTPQQFATTHPWTLRPRHRVAAVFRSRRAPVLGSGSSRLACLRFEHADLAGPTQRRFDATRLFTC